MDQMQIEWLGIDSVKPYEKNAKKHDREQVEHIANSLKRFGWKQPLVIDADGVIVVGHGRYLAARQLGRRRVPCIRAVDLTAEEIKAYRLADNKTNESDWDLDLMNIELGDLLDFDMSDFGFDDLEDDEPEPDDHDGLRSSLQHNVFENQERMQFESDGFYGIPIMQATQTSGDQLLRFCDYKDVDDLSGYIAHFYYDDYKFIQAWRDPDKYLDTLRRFKAVIAPDFSLYTDFPRALQILSCYRRQWCGAYWQSLGIDVIPDVVWGDVEPFAYCFDGIPKGSVVAVSTVGVSNDSDWNGQYGELFRLGYNEMLKRLEPTKVIFYGTILDGLGGDIIRVPSFYEQKRQMLNERSKRGTHGER